MAQVEHMFNSRGEVAVALPPLESKPVHWSVDEEKIIWLAVPGSLDLRIEISPDCVDRAITQERLLVIEVDRQNGELSGLRETWTPFHAD